MRHLLCSESKCQDNSTRLTTLSPKLNGPLHILYDVPASRALRLHTDKCQSSRDLEQQVPINFVPHSSVSLSQACFGNGVYVDTSAQQCISNLLGSEFQSFYLDLYWDKRLRQYSFCPISIPANDIVAKPSTTGAATSSPANANLSQTLTSGGHSPRAWTGILARQASNSISTSTIPAMTVSSTTETATQPPIFTFQDHGDTVYQLGPYNCTSTITLDFVNGIFLGWIRSTSDTIQANILYVLVNLHVAQPIEQSGEPAQEVNAEDLPPPSQSLSTTFSRALSQYVYTPTDLQNERSNMNNSWLALESSRQPFLDYMTVQRLNSRGELSTTDGWPCQAYIQRKAGKRVFIGWDTVDSQMAKYNLTNDDGYMFPPGELDEPRAIIPDDNGAILTSGGCFYDPDQISVANVNNSFATTQLFHLEGNLIDNTTSCGMSPILNSTLNNGTADQYPGFYLEFSQIAVWNWAEGEPINSSVVKAEPNYDKSETTNNFRCAVMDISPAYLGHWRVEDCTARYRAACREGGQPYQWRISQSNVDYTSAAEAESVCTGNSSFSVPHTGLENMYLYHTALRDLQATDASARIWVNFNSLDYEGCWVSGGPNATCPYFIDESALQTRTVLVPTIAAIVVLILTALTLFVKCNTNRRRTRRRRRGLDGWEYEGVPS